MMRYCGILLCTLNPALLSRSCQSVLSGQPCMKTGVFPVVSWIYRCRSRAKVDFPEAGVPRTCSLKLRIPTTNGYSYYNEVVLFYLVVKCFHCCVSRGEKVH